MTRANPRAGRPKSHVPPHLVYQLRAQGLSFREISRRTGFGYGSVRRAYHNYVKDSSAKG